MFNRDLTTGKLNIVEIHKDGEPYLDRFSSPRSVIVSPDVRNVYVTAYNDSSLNMFGVFYFASDIVNDVNAERDKWDANNDNTIGLEEAIQALQVSSGGDP